MPRTFEELFVTVPLNEPHEGNKRTAAKASLSALRFGYPQTILNRGFRFGFPQDHHQSAMLKRNDLPTPGTAHTANNSPA
jgi:hypothetical protein